MCDVMEKRPDLNPLRKRLYQFEETPHLDGSFPPTGHRKSRSNCQSRDERNRPRDQSGSNGNLRFKAVPCHCEIFEPLAPAHEILATLGCRSPQLQTTVLKDPRYQPPVDLGTVFDISRKTLR